MNICTIYIFVQTLQKNLNQSLCSYFSVHKVWKKKSVKMSSFLEHNNKTWHQNENKIGLKLFRFSTKIITNIDNIFLSHFRSSDILIDHNLHPLIKTWIYHFLLVFQDLLISLFITLTTRTGWHKPQLILSLQVILSVN
jgi:hypothetical protein